MSGLGFGSVIYSSQQSEPGSYVFSLDGLLTDAGFYKWTVSANNSINRDDYFNGDRLG